jgi:hypothetical protein
MNQAMHNKVEDNQQTNILESHIDKMRALDHQCPFLIEKLLKECIVTSEDEAEALFTEVKKYMIMVQIEPQRSWQMYSLRVDEAWHQFVLFTREYVDFCREYFDVYVHHVPSNAPAHESDEAADLEERPIPTFDEFCTRYEEIFGHPISDVWLDETSVNKNRRVVNYNAGELRVNEGDQGMSDLVLSSTGRILLSVDRLAHEALKFIAQTGAFYVRELPGDLDDYEKSGLIGVLVETKVLRVAP